MTEFMKYRGPDATEIWSQGPAGLGHTMLRVSDQAEHERQPCSIDGRYWIVADVRVDARAALMSELRGGGERPRDGVTDPELILHSYRLWGENLVDHLLGDFAFGVWDAQDQTLFCARDQMGVKLFYYSDAGKSFVFSNTLNCVRQNPTVSTRLNEAAIGDFLLFGMNRDLSTTTFADIRQLPPGHTLLLSQKTLRLRRYWVLPLPSELRYKDSRDYVENFKHLLLEAVTDRLPSASASILMSGGLDSPALAAYAKNVLSRRSVGSPLHAITVVNPRGDGNEGYYAGLAAARIGIPIHYIDGEQHRYFARWGLEETDRPEPLDNPLLSLEIDQFREAASYGRVLLTGYDGDAVLAPSRQPYIAHLLRRRSYGQFIRAAGLFVYTQRRLPKFGAGRFVGRNPGTQATAGDDNYPRWLNADFERRAQLRKRWAEANNRNVPSAYELRDDAFKFLADNPQWNNLFTAGDPGVTGFSVELRHPLADVRMISFCLSLPQVPWCIGKYILRVAMKGVLPAAVLNRPKTPFRGFQRPSSREHGRLTQIFLSSQRMQEYVQSEHVSIIDSKGRPETHWLNLRPLELSHWLRGAGLADGAH